MRKLHLLNDFSEFLGKENNETFWKYVNKVADKFSGLKKEWKELKNEKKYELAVEQAAGLVDLGLLDLLKFSLSLRAFSPAVQLFQQVGILHFHQYLFDTFYYSTFLLFFNNFIFLLHKMLLQSDSDLPLFQIGSEYSSINCDSFFDVNGKIGCTPQELENVLKNPPKEYVVLEV